MRTTLLLLYLFTLPIAYFIGRGVGQNKQVIIRHDTVNHPGTVMRPYVDSANPDELLWRVETITEEPPKP